MNRLTSATAVLAGLASALAAGPSSAQDRALPAFELGVYGGGAFNTSWFSDPDDSGFGIGPQPIFGAQTTFWASPSFGVRFNGMHLPGAGTVVRGGREVHILPSTTEDVTGASGGFGFSMTPPGFFPVPPGTRSFYSYEFFHADDSRSGRIEPNTDPVGFTLDRVFVFRDGNTTTGLFGGDRGMDARQTFEIEQHRLESGLAVPIPMGPGTFIFTPGSVTQISNQEFQTSLSLITLPDIAMTESRETEERLWGPMIGGAFQLPVSLSRDGVDAFPILFFTLGGEASVLFGDTKFKSVQTLTCPVCGPDFPVRQVTSGKIDNPVESLGAYFRTALAVGPRANLFVEVNVDRTERGSFITPANPDQQPLRIGQQDVTDVSFRLGGSIGFGGGPPPPP